MKKIIFLLAFVFSFSAYSQQIGANQIKKDSVTIKGNSKNKLCVDTTKIATKNYVSSNYFKLNGNSFGGNKFLGSTDNYDLDIRTNNISRAHFDKSGYFLIGNASGNYHSYFQSNIDSIRFAVHGYSKYSNILLDSTQVKINGNLASYQYNYNARKTDLSIPNYKYVDSAITAALPVQIKTYDALLSQNAPISSRSNPSLVAGQIWRLDSFASGTQLSKLELVSGTLNVVGSTYRMIKDTALSLDVGTTLSYDGSPYIVSVVNGVFAPFKNTLEDTPVYTYGLAGGFYVTCTNGIFVKGKYSITGTVIGNQGLYGLEWSSNTTLVLTSMDHSMTRTDGILYYTPITFYIHN